jgi:hypothetical protein
MGNHMTTNLKIDDIRRDGGTQPRASIDYQAVQDYADAMRDGAKFPPVVVFYDGSQYWLADGFHRVEAALLEGREEVAADIHQGTVEDAQWFSFGANKTNGIRRDNRDKQRAIQTALKHPKSQGLSDREIARHLGVHHDTVSEWRKRLEASVGIRQIETRTATRQGATYEINITNIGGQKRAAAPAPDYSNCVTCGAAFAEPVWHCPQCGHHWPHGVTGCRNCQAEQTVSTTPTAGDAAESGQSEGAHCLVGEWTARVYRACTEIAACQISAQDLAATIRSSSSSEQLKKQLETTNEFIETVLANLS